MRVAFVTLALLKQLIMFVLKAEKHLNFSEKKHTPLTCYHHLLHSRDSKVSHELSANKLCTDSNPSNQ